uniref:Gypsy retrotransposon integrase-like protein 1 n=1 Tax=Paramormyrops kingsleyae TaxID=1676925 RepID=A0A3B3T249_9TELE
MNSVLAGLIYKSCAVYLDDIVVASPTFEQHLQDLKDVFLRLRSAGLTIKLAKCQFCRKEFNFLGYRVCRDGILPDQGKVNAVLHFETPVNVRQNTVLQYYHDHPTAGHLGMTKTLARLKHRFFWPNMSSGVKTYVSSCKVCQLTKPCQRKPAGLMVPIRPQGPWEFVGVDFVGPLPRTSNGNAYILVFVDYFSKWVEIVAVKEATAQVAASRLLSEVFSRHGAPTHLISDRGSPFVSHLFEKLLTLIGTEHRLTTAYHPTLKTAIRAYVDDKHTSWDKYIPQICFALRTAPHESTGQSPAMLLYGRELNTPLDLVTHPNGDGELDIDIPYLEQLQSSLREAHEHAKASLEVNHARRKKYYDKRRRSVNFSIGDLIRVRNHPKSDFHQTQVKFLGYVIWPGTVAMDEWKVAAIQDWLRPHTIKELQGFLGFEIFYCHFITEFQPRSSTLYLPHTRKRNSSSV